MDGEGSGKNGKNELEKDASIKEEDAKHETDKLPDHPSLKVTIDARSEAYGIGTGSGSGFGSALTRGQLFLNGWIDRLRWLVVNMMGMNGGNLILLYGIQRLCLSLILCGVHRRGRRRGEQIVDRRSCNPLILGDEGEMDISIVPEEIVYR